MDIVTNHESYLINPWIWVLSFVLFLSFDFAKGIQSIQCRSLWDSGKRQYWSGLNTLGIPQLGRLLDALRCSLSVNPRQPHMSLTLSKKPQKTKKTVLLQTKEDWVIANDGVHQMQQC